MQSLHVLNWAQSDRFAFVVDITKEGRSQPRSGDRSDSGRARTATPQCGLRLATERAQTLRLRTVPAGERHRPNARAPESPH